MDHLYTKTLGAILKEPDRPGLLCEDKQVSYGQLAGVSQAIAGRLLEIAPDGDSESTLNIGLLAPNTPACVAGYLGILAADKVVVPLNYLLKPQELLALASHAGLRIVLASAPFYEQACGWAEKLPIEVVNLDAFFALAEPPAPVPTPTRSGDDTAVILYTSGTTGNPKGVELTHTNIGSDCDAVLAAYPFSGEETFVSVLPLFHSFGMTAMMFLPLAVGAPIVLVPQFNPGKVAKALESNTNCILFAVPAMFQLLAHFAASRQVHFPNLKLGISGGAGLPMAIKEGFEAATGATIYQGYGLTETSPVVSINLPGKHVPGTIGLPLPGIEVAVWGENGSPQPMGEVGELMVRGSIVMKGYYKSPSSTKEVLSPEGWLRTGDMAFLNAEGYPTIVGRCKELIVFAGENIYPPEVEEVLLRFPTVAEAAVVGIPDERKGEVPKAYLSAVPEQQIDLAALEEFCREQLAGFKVPVEFEVCEELPKTPAGKILKRMLT